jgi:hypothetical protein
VDAGKTQTLRLTIPTTDLEKWNEAKAQMEVFAGNYKLLLGSNSSDVILQAEFSIEN